MKSLLLASVVFVPLAAHADLKADTAVKVDLIKANFALMNHDLAGAVEALSDATKYLPQASDEAVHDLATMNAKVGDVIQTQTQKAKPVAKEEPKPQVKPLFHHYVHQWPYPGGVSAAVRPGEKLKDDIVPSTSRSQKLPGWYAQGNEGKWAWFPGQTEAPPGTTPPGPSPPTGFGNFMDRLSQKEHKTWTSYPYPH